MIQSADLIYLSGGNYIQMISEWKEHKLDEKLLSALQQGTPLQGVALVLCAGSHLASAQIMKVPVI